jgi:hypothetical protein
MAAAAATSWLRGKASELARQKQPWFLAVNLVNPHDVMFYDTDEPGQPLQGANTLTHIASDPAHALYAKQWDFELPASFSQALDGPGRPKARDLLQQGGPEKIKEAGLRPDMMKRGAIRSVCDGRHQFTRYFSPKQFS